MFKRMTMLAGAIAACLMVSWVSVSLAQQAPNPEGSEVPSDRTSYNAIFEEFKQLYEVQQTKLDRMAKDEKAPPEERQAVFNEIKKIDAEYVAALQKYIEKNPNAKDLEPARYEVMLTLSRHEDRLAEAIKAADEYLKEHAGSERVKDVKFARAQCLVRSPGKEEEALKSLEGFINEYSASEEADFARTMRIRVMLFIDRAEEAEDALNALLKLDKVRKNKEAREYIERQLDDLDWIGRELPKFALSTLDGKAVANEDFAGKPLLVFIWDSNSSVCLEELGYVKAAWDKYHDIGFNVLGVSVNESKPALEQWLKRNSTGFANSWEDRAADGTFIKRLDVKAIPFNILVDSKGKVYRYDVRSDDLMRYVARMIERNK